MSDSWYPGISHSQKSRTSHKFETKTFGPMIGRSLPAPATQYSVVSEVSDVSRRALGLDRELLTAWWSEPNRWLWPQWGSDHGGIQFFLFHSLSKRKLLPWDALMMSIISSQWKKVLLATAVLWMAWNAS